MARTLPTILLIALLAGTALTGCFTPGAETEKPTHSISRSYAIHMDEQKSEQLSQADSPDEFVRALVDASLVVRVSEKGDYTLTYTDESGMPQTKLLTGLDPGAPRVVEGVDPFTAATLTGGTAVLASRAPVPSTWWRIGDVPLGVKADAPAAAEYDYRSFATLDAALSGVTSDDGRSTLDSLVAQLALPAVGTMKWSLSNAGVEERLDLSGKFGIDDTRGSLLFAEVKGTFEGEPATAGVEVQSGNAEVEAAVALFLRNGQIQAGQFQGASMRADPVVYAWATGAAAESGEVPCAGKTRQDRCQPEQIEAVSEREPAGERDDVPEDEFRVDLTDEDERAAFELLQKLLAHDLGVHDQLVVSVSSSSPDYDGYSGPTYSMSFRHEVLVAAKEALTVPAGTYGAYRIVQTSAMQFDVDEVSSEQCVSWGEYGCEQYETRSYFRDYSFDDTLVRSTLWLDSATFQPLKGTVEAPADMGAIVRDLLSSLDSGAWESAMIEAFDPSKLQLTVDSESSFEATRLAGNTRLAPVVGLALGSLMSGTLASAVSPVFGAAPFAQPPMMMEEAYPVSPPRYLSLYMEQPIGPDGAAVVGIGGVSPDFYWSDVSIAVDGSYRSFSFDADCDAGESWEFVACGTDGEPKSFRDLIESGDTIRLPGVQSGQELRIMDSMTNSVIMSMRLS